MLDGVGVSSYIAPAFGDTPMGRTRHRDCADFDPHEMDFERRRGKELPVSLRNAKYLQKYLALCVEFFDS